MLEDESNLLFEPDCPAPQATVFAPTVRLPAGATDCHFHAFGPYARFPLSRGRTYTPPEAPLERYRKVADTLGIERFVIVQPSVYGSDNRCTLDALAKLGPASARAVIGMPEQDDPAVLRKLHALGVRGVRYNSVTGESTSPDHLLSVARRIAPLGWHLQLYAGPAELEGLLPQLAEVPVDVVVDHLGQIDPAEGIGGRAFTAVCRFLDSGKGWIKLVGYRCSRRPWPYEDLVPCVRSLARSHGDRLVWGTDWPHPVRYQDMPEDGALADALAAWLDDGKALRRVLVDNPCRLYGFGAG